MEHKGLRYNQDKKSRPELLPPYAIDRLAQIMKVGAEKYAPRNWEKGMAWTTVLASLKRHLSDYEKGMDYDPDDGQLLISKVMVNAAFLTEYYGIYPQGDDRQHKFLSIPRIGLDIDDVCCDFIGGFARRFGLQLPNCWKWSYSLTKIYHELLANKGEAEAFYLGLDTKIDPNILKFEPTCYITSRPISTEVTENWIENNGFPCAPVYTVGLDGSKVEIAKRENLDFFIDDRFENFVELNNAGICTFLLDAPHNQRYDVGFKRIHNINDIFDLI